MSRKHSRHCNHSSHVNLASLTAAWPQGRLAEGWMCGSSWGKEGGREGFVLCCRRHRSESSWCPGRIRHRENMMTEKDGRHQTPTPAPPLPLRVNTSIRLVPEIEAMPTMMPSPGLSEHLILTKHSTHTAQHISLTCFVLGSINMKETHRKLSCISLQGVTIIC